MHGLDVIGIVFTSQGPKSFISVLSYRCDKTKKRSEWKGHGIKRPLK